ncbi:hypothetical protein EC991_002293 [Linnemannia zychae]|nr:hypothetical protein EC991_002293 [Linnemannia zychae]
MLEKVLDIPELLAHLAVYLPPQDLLSCVQVNYQWNELFIPSLWHTINDKTRSWDTILKTCADPKTTVWGRRNVDPNRVRESDKDKDQEWVKAVFRKYGQYVKVLSIHWPLLLEAYSSAMERVENNGAGSDGLESLTIDLRSTVQGPRERDPNFIPLTAASIPPAGDLAQVNVSEPLFPEYINKDDFTPAKPYSGMTKKSNEEALEYGWIEVFRATGNPWYIDESRRNPHDRPNQVLVDCASLREFHFIEHYLWADEMLKKPWACLGLEWLSCRIVGLDRLNDEEKGVVDRVRMRTNDAGAGTTDMMTEEETAAMEKFYRCQRQHHGVYDQLAQLTRLKHLDLGYESRYPWTYKSGEHYEKDGVGYLFYSGGKTFDTLELSLDSGLDRLGALKDLEMFGFECLNHRVGKKELDWMAKSWPKLNLMYGLDKERLMDIEYDQERAALKIYFEELRPDVVHDSLFQDAI